MRNFYSDGDTFERGGRTFKIELPRDEHTGPSWENGDGYGIVGDWTSRESKRPGERLLHSDGRSVRFYDVEATTAKAKKEAWGLGEKELAQLTAKLGRKPTRKQIVAQAVEIDFEFHRRWCADLWCYIGVVVTLMREDDDGELVETGQFDSLFGIESDCDEYITETAHNMADVINDDANDDMAAAIQAERPDLQPCC